jgi:chromosomal replication initiator protein
MSTVHDISPLPSAHLTGEVPAWQDLVRRHFGTTVYQDWFAQLTPVRFDQGILTLAAPSRFVKDWIETHYLEMMCALFSRDLPTCTAILLEIDEPASAGQTSDSAPQSNPSGKALAGMPSFSVEDDQDIQSASLDPGLVFDSFVVGKPNEFAYAAAQRVAESDEPVYNPLFLYGPSGHGKTHLMHSIAHRILQRSNGQKKILYLSAEKFMYYFIRALQYKSIMAFKERFRSVHVLIIDDVQFISGKDSTQEEFFHTFNALVDAKRQVILSADKPPSDLQGLQERMKSRLGWGLAADLHPTTYELRLGILHKKAQQQNVEVPTEVLSFLATQISSSVRELEGALNRVIAHSTLVGGSITTQLVQSTLQDILRPTLRAVSLDEIDRRVCDYFRIRITDLHSAKRTRIISRPRQIAMFLAKMLTQSSLPSIGRHFGGRDHTTVLHAVSTIENLLKWDKTAQEDVTLLRQCLENI